MNDRFLLIPNRNILQKKFDVEERELFAVNYLRYWFLSDLNILEFNVAYF